MSVSLLQAQPQFYVSAIGGAAALSADGAMRGGSSPAASSYTPVNGGAWNVAAGVHATEFMSFQGNYIWNANDVTLSGLTGNRLTDTLLRSRQDAAIADFLLYFRNRRSRIRPYLSVGTGFVRIQADRATGASLFRETQSWPLRVAVGIDLMAKNGWGLRYSFSETISGNPFSARLDPPGPRKLANFQNLVGVVKYFGR